MPGGGVEGSNMGLWFNGYSFSFIRCRDLWTGGGGYTIICVYSMPLNCALKNGYDGEFYIM